MNIDLGWVITEQKKKKERLKWLKWTIIAYIIFYEVIARNCYASLLNTGYLPEEDGEKQILEVSFLNLLGLFLSFIYDT